MIELMSNNKLNCNICLENLFDNDEHYKCRNCTSTLCNDCYDLYVNEYQYTSCPQCRTNIIEIPINIINRNPNLNVDVTNVQDRLTFSEKYILNLFILILFIPCYFIGTVLTGYDKLHVGYIIFNFLFGMLMIISCIFFLFIICRIFFAILNL